MKMSRRERKIYNAGIKAGYSEGYAKGLYDGNPFNAIIEAAKTLTVTISEKLNDPAFVEYLKEQGDIYDDVLTIEEGDK